MFEIIGISAGGGTMFCLRYESEEAAEDAFEKLTRNHTFALSIDVPADKQPHVTDGGASTIVMSDEFGTRISVSPMACAVIGLNNLSSGNMGLGMSKTVRDQAIETGRRRASTTGRFFSRRSDDNE